MAKSDGVTNVSEQQAGGTQEQAPGSEGKPADTRISEDRMKKVEEFMANQKVVEAETNAKTQVDAAESDQDSLKQELEKALLENKALKDNRRKELLLTLDPKDQERFKDRSVEALETLQEYRAGKPTLGASRPAKEGSEADKDKPDKQHPGYYEGINTKTGKAWGK